MKKCPFCAEEIQDEAIRCKHCNGDIQVVAPAGKPKVDPRLWILFAVCVVGLFSWVILREPETPLRQTEKHKATDQEKVFISSSISYLKTVYSDGMAMLTVMGGATTGTSSLSDVRRAVSNELTVEKAAYRNDYKAKTAKAGIPANWTVIAKNIEDGHLLYEDGLEETLRFWADNNTAHIEAGTATLKRAIELFNATVTLANKAMDGIAP